MIRAQPGRKNLAEVGQLRLQAFDIETDGTAAGEGQRDDPGRGIALGKFDRKQIERCVLIGLVEVAALAGVNAFEPQRGPAAAVTRRIDAPGTVDIDRIHPVETLERHHEPMLAWLPEYVGDLDERVLHMGRDDLDVVLVEGDEFKFFFHSLRPRRS